MKSFPKRMFFLIKLTTIAIFILEIFFTLFYLINKGGYSSVSSLLFIEKKNSTIFNKQAECTLDKTTMMHPHLSYIYKPVDGCKPPNNVGLHGVNFPHKYNKDNFTILITGGSVANDLISSNQDYFINRLNSDFIPPGKKKKFVVLTGGLSGWQQPNQLILFSMYNNILDGLITLDGYNEHLKILADKFKLETPTRLFYHHTKHNLDFLIDIYRSNYAVFNENYLTSHSHLLYFIGNQIRKQIIKLLDKPIQDKAKIKSILNPYFSTPKDLSRRENIDYNIDTYKNYIKYMHYISQGRKIKEAYFLQPHPHILKTLTKEEKRVTKTLADPMEYKYLVNKLLELKGEDIPIYSLLDIFKPITRTIYADHIHCIVSSKDSKRLGYSIISDKIINVIAKEWNFKRRFSKRGNLP